ncbi:hypothetical protein EXIGLDRAFT_46382 [Exidia glandulosa HHB12029]|uniref:Autophagy-related protein 27 n=1 Tax=Exidia glandulosa HHB12029 TaxID=1314781 RepID=A0A165P4C1_EXIGL|nr:hypothetical protein EXIGLDRAFT_46382 [Exidia glandulosa HHB12029]
MLVAHFIVLHVLLLAASAAFTRQACWQRNCLTRNDAGALCFVPSARKDPMHTCKDDILAQLLSTHVNSTFGVSIAYYNERASLVGTSSFLVANTSPLPLFVCMSGRDAQDGAPRTLCRLAVHDDDVLEVEAHTRECWIDVGQRVATDGCYTPTHVPSTSKPTRKSRYSVVGVYSTAPSFVLFCALAVVLGGCTVAVRYRSARANFLSAAGRMGGRWSKRAILATANVLPRARPLTSAFLILLSFTIPGFDAYGQASTATELSVPCHPGSRLPC